MRRPISRTSSRVRAEGHADVIDAPQRMQIEIDLGAGAGEAADIDDAAEQRHRLHRLRHHRPRQHVDHEIDALAVQRPSSPPRAKLGRGCRRRDRRRTSPELGAAGVVGGGSRSPVSRREAWRSAGP